MKYVFLSCIFLTILLFVQCGTNVEVGRNAQYDPGISVTDTGEEDTLSHGCFSSSDEIPSLYQKFCDNVANPEQMSDIERIVCEEKRISHLWKAECGWDGQINAERGRYFRTLEHTPLEDSSKIFSYLATYSLSFANTGGLKSFMNIVLSAHGNTPEFLKKYTLPDSTRIEPLAWTASLTEPFAKYRIEVDTSIGRTLEYHGHMHGFASKDSSHEILQSYLLSEKSHKNILASSTLIFSGFLEDGTYKIVAIEHRVIPDEGFHNIAWNTSKKSDFNRMRLYYDYTLPK